MATSADLIISGGIVVSPTGLQPADIVVRDGRIEALLAHGSGVTAERVVDARGRYILPGAIDPHVHLYSGTRTLIQSCEREGPSFLLGGVTSCFTFVSSDDSYPDVVKGEIETIERHSLVNVGFTLTLFHEHHLAELRKCVDQLGVISFKMYNGAGGLDLFLPTKGVTDDFFLRACESIRDLGSPCFLRVHAENWHIARMLAERLRSAGREDAPAWTESRPDFVEVDAVQRAILLAGWAGCPLYLVHITTEETPALTREARRRGQQVWLETCPHYLAVHKDHPLAYVAKEVPSVKDAEDVEALWKGVADGTIDVLAADHISIRAEDKGLERSIWDSRAGMPGSATILPLLLSEGYHRRGIPLEQIAAVTSGNAARIFGLYPRKGAILPGSDADLVVVDLEREVDFQPEMVAVDFSPLTGMHFKGWPVMTIVAGQVAMEDGKVVAEPGLAQYLAGTG